MLELILIAKSSDLATAESGQTVHRGFNYGLLIPGGKISQGESGK